MSTTKRILYIIIVTAIGTIAVACLPKKSYLFKALWYNFANIDDYKKFENNPVNINKPQPWKIANTYNQIAYPDTINQLLETLSTVGLLIIKNDSIQLEKYWDEYNQRSLSGSFSMAKSITSILIGIALQENKIKSLQEPVGNYIPEFKIGKKSAVKIIDLLTMSSGSNWNESYMNPFSITTESYYGDDLYNCAVNGIDIVNTPGTLLRYKSGDTQLLGLILEQATKQSLSQYASEKLWQAIGAETTALWSTDKKNGHEKAFCCFNSNVRDFARIGKLMLNKGLWNNKKIIDSNYVKQSITPCGITDNNGQKCDYYGYQWWIDPLHPDIFYARGILGQYIIVIPKKQTIIVRLGKMTHPQRIHTVPKEVRYLINWGLNL